jgi:hypothetical protein
LSGAKATLSLALSWALAFVAPRVRLKPDYFFESLAEQGFQKNNLVFTQLEIAIRRYLKRC